MATRYLTESFDGGVVDTRNPLYLVPGELSAGTNCYYSAHKDILLKVPVIATALASASACGGLQHVFFTSTEHLLTHGAGAYYKATITSNNGALGALSAVVSGLSVTSIPETFAAIQHNNKYVLLDGLNTPQVLRSDLTCRRLGLQPVITVAQAATATAASNTWPGRTIGYFDYWYTEVAEYGTSPEDVIIESSYEATVTSDSTGSPSLSVGNAVTTNGRPIKIAVATVNVTTLATKVSIDLPLAPRNTTATHYYVYRSLAKDFEVEPSFPIGEKIARVAIPTSESDASIVNGRIRIVDGAITSSGPFYPTTYVTNTVSTGVTWTNPERVSSDNSTEYTDGSYARLTVAPSGGSISPIPANQVIVSTISATGIYDPVSLLKVSMRAKLAGGFLTSGVYLNVRISGNAGSSWSAAVPITLTATATGGTEVSTIWSNFGNPYLSTTDIANANLRIRVDISGYKPSSGAGDGYVDIDGMRVEIQHNGTVPVPIGAYPGIVIQVGQDKFVSSKGGEPPVASLGCMYKGSLVTNDVANKNMVRWSMPGEIDAFPSLYYFPVQAPKGSSEITYLGVVNNICIIGMKGATARINYLPSENDSSFMRDSIYDYISTDVGIANATCAATYRNHDGREVLAIVTTDGVLLTDGFTTHKVDRDFNFSTILSAFTANSNSIHSAARLSLVNELHTQNLFLVYNSASETYIRPMNWSSNHVKEGGQFKMGGTWATGEVFVATVATKTLLGYPVVYMLNNAYAIKRILPTSTSVKSGAFQASTRLISVSQPPSEFDLKQAYLYSGENNSLTNMYLAAVMWRSEKATQSVTSSTTSTTYGIGKVDIGASGEFTCITVYGPSDTTASSLGHITLEYDDQLATESM